jgi:hypothetical protein
MYLDVPLILSATMPLAKALYETSAYSSTSRQFFAAFMKYVFSHKIAGFL